TPSPTLSCPTNTNDQKNYQKRHNLKPHKNKESDHRYNPKPHGIKEMFHQYNLKPYGIKEMDHQYNLKPHGIKEMDHHYNLKSHKSKESYHRYNLKPHKTKETATCTLTETVCTCEPHGGPCTIEDFTSVCCPFAPGAYGCQFLDSPYPTPTGFCI
ncbi:15723_t:CDS:1, partial [Gigaspora rosea]